MPLILCLRQNISGAKRSDPINTTNNILIKRINQYRVISILIILL